MTSKDEGPRDCQLRISPECSKGGFDNPAMIQFPDGHWGIPNEKRIFLTSMGKSSALSSAVYACMMCTYLRGTTRKALNGRFRQLKQERALPFQDPRSKRSEEE